MTGTTQRSPGERGDGIAAAASAAARSPSGRSAARRDAGGPDRHWTAVGPRDATTIVFVHGTRLTRSQWWPQLRRLSGRYRCVAVDLPGHGTRADERFTLAAASASIAAAIDAESNGGRAVVVGFSLGGYVAVETAEAYPDRVLGLVLAGCSADPVGPTALALRAFAWVMEHVPAAVLDRLSTTFFRARYRRIVAEPIVDGGFWSAGGAAAIRTLVARRYLQRVGRLWTPVTIVNGALDPVFAPGGESWASAARRGVNVVIPWALHLSNLDSPAVFTRAVVAAVEEAVAHEAPAL